MAPADCVVRPAASLAEAHNIYWPLMQTLGWERGIADSITHFQSAGGRDGFLVVISADKPDIPEGMIVALPFANKTGWIGFFCINDQFRGSGWGGKLFAAALERFKSSGVDVVGLDAVQEQVGTYGRRGFVETALIDVRSRPSLEELPAGELPQVPQGSKLVSLEDVPSHVLVAYDLVNTGLERAKLWTEEALFARKDVYGFAVVDADSEKHEWLDGLVLVRECSSGYRIGPLYAETQEVAEVLLTSAIKRAENENGKFNTELWSNNAVAAQVFERAGFSDVLVSYHRMWLDGRVPEAQRPGGAADKNMYAIFDAGEG